MQLQENIFTESNTLMKSIQVILDALNELRLCHVLGRATRLSGSNKRESVKVIYVENVYFIKHCKRKEEQKERENF